MAFLQKRVHLNFLTSSVGMATEKSALRPAQARCCWHRQEGFFFSNPGGEATARSSAGHSLGTSVPASARSRAHQPPRAAARAPLPGTHLLCPSARAV